MFFSRSILGATGSFRGECDIALRSPNEGPLKRRVDPWFPSETIPCSGDSRSLRLDETLGDGNGPGEFRAFGFL